MSACRDGKNRQIRASGRIEAGVQHSLMYTWTPFSSVCNRPFVRLDSFDIPESFQGIEEQACTTSDIEEFCWTVPPGQESGNLVQEDTLPGAPPPMPPVQIRIGSRVLVIHLMLERSER